MSAGFLSEGLLPCPFCGSAATLFASSDHSTAWEGGCGNDKCNINPQVWEVSKDAAIAAWNRRSEAAIEEAVLARVAPTWISVEERIPEMNDFVLVACHNVDRAVQWRRVVGWRWTATV
jgi:hypothetical protein